MRPIVSLPFLLGMRQIMPINAHFDILNGGKMLSVLVDGMDVKSGAPLSYHVDTAMHKLK